MSVYHSGEHFIQDQMGVRHKSDSLSSMIKKDMPVVAAQFLENIHFSVMTFELKNKTLFSAVVFDIKPFIQIVNSNEILINLDKKSFIPQDIMDGKGLVVGFLGLEFETRMRIRINGKGSIQNNTLHLIIDEVYSNCPKYITNRKLMDKIDFDEKPTFNQYNKLNDRCKNIIQNANTIFLASSHEEKGADISHKGGKEGFLNILSPSQLELHDYVGNNMYNTLGNIHTNENISIIIIDFIHNDVVHINGTANTIEELKNGKKTLKTLIKITQVSIESNVFSLKYDK
jgi:predicted pyridoxine 5'-phosphate oxidase superfamily flavin-nucleotide-binding protein